MGNPKVFEFAKEVGLETLTLMDKIREWQLPVKNHMAELTPDMIDQIKSRLNPKKESVEVKKTVAKKKVAPKKVESAEAAAPAASASKVVRRKAGPTEPEKLAEKVATPKVEAAEPVEAVEVAPKVVAKPVEKKVTVPKIETVVPAVEPVVVKKEIPVTAAADKVVATAAPVPAQANEEKKAPTPAAPATPHHAVTRKKEVVVGQSGHQSPQRAPDVGRKNIIGRMDLSRVQPPPQQGYPRSGGFNNNNNQGSGPRPQGSFTPRTDRPQGGFNQGGGFNNSGPRPQGGGFNSSGPRPASGPGGAPGGARPFARNNNIRPGFVASAEPMPEENDRRSKFEDKSRRVKDKADVGGSGAGGAEEQEFTFNSSDFKKREMVFQPKKKKGLLGREGKKTEITKAAAHKRQLKVNGTMKLGDAAQEMGVKAAQLMKTLMANGVMANMNTDLDFDTLSLIVTEFGWEAVNVFKTADEVLDDTAFGDLDAEAIIRPPVVTVMGHVDHGKTSLLDAIRQTDVAAGEAGGITQHIGAYQVKLETGELITFLDTPGHAAFTAMRARGANVTDIAVIVVAADDGMMPQTAEAISHAKAAGVPIIIAVNKMDKPGANPEKIKQQLTELEIVPEEWGGSNIYCEVSALKRTGVKELLEQILLVAEVQELKANPKRSGTGTVIESRLEKGKGPVASLLVQDGTIRVGDILVAGTCGGRVRSLVNDKGEKVEEAVPGMPVEVLGLSEVPSAGDKWDVVKDDKTLEKAIELRKEAKAKADAPSAKLTIEDIFSKVKQGDKKTLNIIMKADVAGSAEAINGMFKKLETEEVKIKTIHWAVGGITESDVLLATTSKSVVIGFNTRPDSGAQALAKRNGIEIRTYSIVYEMVDDLKRLMSGLLDPEIKEEVHGRAEVRNTFTVPKIGTIAGCAVTDGKIARNHLVRLIRDGVVVYQGKVSSLKRFKDDAREVAQGFECGIGIENYNDLKVGDIIEAYTREEFRRELTELSPS